MRCADKEGFVVEEEQVVGKTNKNSLFSLVVEHCTCNAKVASSILAIGNSFLFRFFFFVSCTKSLWYVELTCSNVSAAMDQASKKEYGNRGLNPGPVACKANVIPLHHSRFCWQEGRTQMTSSFLDYNVLVFLRLGQ
jgi:hypothetical protein